jgi:hypothetical protein
VPHRRAIGPARGSPVLQRRDGACCASAIDLRVQARQATWSARVCPRTEPMVSRRLITNIVLDWFATPRGTRRGEERPWRQLRRLAAQLVWC